MDNKPDYKGIAGSRGQVVIGVIVMVVGLAFLFDSLGLLDLDFTLHLWPVLLIVFGCLRLSQTRYRSGHVVGVAMIVIGALMTLSSLGLFHISKHVFWPLVLIAVGLSVVFKSVTGHRLLDRDSFRNKYRAGYRDQSPSGVPGDLGAPGPAVSLDKGGSDDDAIIDVTAILGGYKRRITCAAFRGGEITAIMAGCELDLRQSSIQTEAVLTVFAMWGGITIKVPPDWTVVLHGTPIMGGFEEKTIVPPDTSKRLVVRGFVVMGGLEVRN